MATVKYVVARQSKKPVSRVIAHDTLIDLSTGQQCCLDLRTCQYRAIRKLHLINAIAVVGIRIEVRADSQGFTAVFDLDNQIIRLTTHHYVRSIQSL